MAANGMFKTGNQPWSGTVFTAPVNLQPGVSTELAVSDEVANTGGDDGVKVIIQWGPPNPDGKDGGTSFYLYAAVEAKDDAGNWYVLGTQFREYYHSEINPERRIVIDPQISNPFPGTDEQLWLGAAVAAVSNQQGRLPPTAFRLRLYVQDHAPEGPKAFQSVAVTASWEKYSA